MKSFESFLATQFNEFLAYRQDMGYSTRQSRSDLLLFDRYLIEKKADWDALTPSFFLQMRSEISMEAVSINKMLFTLRVFFRFLLCHNYVNQSPMQDVPLLK